MVLKLSVVAANRIAREVTDLVGDGCVVRRVDRRHDMLRAVAVHHRDHRTLKRLRGQMERPPAASVSGWAAQALERNVPVRLRRDEAAEAVGPLLDPSTTSVHGLNAVVAPLRLASGPIGIVVAFRGDAPYSCAEQQLVEHLARGFEDDEATDEGAERPPLLEQLSGDRLLDHLGAGVWTTDLWGVTTYVNEALCELVGLPSSTLIGAGMARHLEDPPEEVYGGHAGRSEARDHRLMGNDGTEAWVSVTCAPLVDAGGRRLGTVSTLTDVTRRKRAEVDLRLRAAAHETVSELAGLALAGADLDRLACDAAEATADLLGAEYAAVCDVDAERGFVVPRAVVGLDPALVGVAMPIGEHSIAAISIDEDEPFVVNDIRDLDLLEASELATTLGVRSTMCMPIGGGTGLIGASSPRPEAFAGRDMGFLRSLSGVLGGRWATLPYSMAAAVPVV